MQAYHKLQRRLRHALARRLPTCAEATTSLSMALEQPLTMRRRLALRLHLLTCRLCHRYAQQLHFLREAAQRFESQPSKFTAHHPHALSAEARARMRRSLQMPAAEE